MTAVDRPFLTALDSRAQIRGSRDPLALQAIWARLGHSVVGNLTTVTDSVRDFTTVMIGYHLASLPDDRGGTDALESFLRFEQLAAYARWLVNDDGRFRGVERVARKVNESPSRLVLSGRREDQILSDQKTYGLWGLYSVSARQSGLLDPSSPGLSPAGAVFFEESYLPALSATWGRDASALVAATQGGPTLLHPKTNRDRERLETIARLLRTDRYSPREREFYREHLLLGGADDSTNGLQEELVSLLQPWLSREESWRGLVTDIAGRSSPALKTRLRRIVAAESVLAPSAALFSFLLSRSNASVDLVAGELARSWGRGLRWIDVAQIEGLGDEILGQVDGHEGTDRWRKIAEALREGDYPSVIDLLAEQNARVMAVRGMTAPWLSIEHDRRLKVRFRDDQAQLPDQTELPTLWRHPYFLPSLLEIFRRLSGAPIG